MDSTIMGGSVMGSMMGSVITDRKLRLAEVRPKCSMA